jgi:N utilization substance protein A
VVRKNFFEYLEQVAFDRGLDINDVLECVKTALEKACKHVGYTGDIIVEIDEDKGKIKLIEQKVVVDEINAEDPTAQITLEDALKEKEKIKIGAIIKREIRFEDLTRKAARQFFQVFTQGLTELERKKQFEFFKERENEIINAKIQKVTPDAVFLDLGLNVDTYMPIKETIKGEELVEGGELKVYLTKVEEGTKGPKIYVSRVHRDIVRRLFEMTIPEVASGVVEIMTIARDAGSRTKIGVMSNNENVDPKGACVGIGGVRIKQINAALNNERIDIFTWKNNPVDLIAEALTPAQVISVIADEKDKTSTVIVPDTQFSLAIGRGGQNARLASQATGWKIDIKDETTAKNDNIEYTPNVGNL